MQDESPNRKETLLNSPAANKLIVVAALLVFLPALSVAFEKDEHDEKASSRKLVTVPAGQVIDNDFFAFGEVVEISGTINGDFYVILFGLGALLFTKKEAYLAARGQAMI